MSRGNMSSDRRVTDLRPPVEAVTGTDKRVCESCGGAIPPRTHRQRNAKGQLVCDSCKDTNMPSWTTTHSALSVLDQSEMARREAEAITSIVRVRKAKHAGLSVVAHDSGDNAIVNHCPFCGSGAVVGGSDGTITCEFCHTSCTVQVQPNHPFTPQTIDGQPVTPPGLPGGEETELSAPLDPTVNEEEEGVNEDALGDADPTKSNGPVAPGQPKSKQPPPFTKADPSTNPGKGTDGAPKKKSLPPWMDKKKSSAREAVRWDEYGVYYSDGTPASVNDIVKVPGISERCHVVQMDSASPSVVWVQPHSQWERDWKPGDSMPRQVEVASLTPIETVYQHFKDRSGPPSLGSTAVQTSDPNSREEHPYPDMGNYVVIADAIRRFIRAGLYSTYEEAKRSGIVDRLKVDGIQSNLTTEDKVQEVLRSTPKKSFRTSTGATLDEQAYMAHLALGMADDREAVLDAVRLENSGE